MRIVLGALMLTIAGTALGAHDRSGPTPIGRAATPARESPFACDRLALSPKERARHFNELGPMLRSMRTGVRELPDGYAFQFPSDPKTLQVVAEWVAGERACCPFFDIDLKLEREGGPFWLSLTGRAGTKAFIQVDNAAWIKQ